MDIQADIVGYMWKKEFLLPLPRADFGSLPWSGSIH